MHVPRLLALTSALALATVPAIATAAPTSRPTPARVDATSRTPVPSDRDAARYAEREAEAPVVAEFAGGNVVIVSISGGALVVLLFLLLLF